MILARRLAALALAAAGLLAGIASAQAPAASAQPDPAAPPVGDQALHDPVFRVDGHPLGLERRVEMYQWVPAEGGYAKAWREQPVAIADQADDIHANPPFPLQGERWTPHAIRVDGHPLAPEVVHAFGQWREFRPGFSNLPGNLSATFQPEGNGLGSAENPLDPQVGDLRIHWRELVLPPLGERIELRQGAWHLRADAPAIAAAPVAARSWMLAWLPIVLGGVGLLALVVVLARRRR
jgi:hypothetical protein